MITINQMKINDLLNEYENLDDGHLSNEGILKYIKKTPEKQEAFIEWIGKMDITEFAFLDFDSIPDDFKISWYNAEIAEAGDYEDENAWVVGSYDFHENYAENPELYTDIK